MLQRNSIYYCSYYSCPRTHIWYLSCSLELSDGLHSWMHLVQLELILELLVPKHRFHSPGSQWTQIFTFEGFGNWTWKPLCEQLQNLCWAPDPSCYLNLFFPQTSSSAGSLGLQLSCLEVHNIWHKLIQGLQRLQKTCHCYTEYKNPWIQWEWNQIIFQWPASFFFASPIPYTLRKFILVSFLLWFLFQSTVFSALISFILGWPYALITPLAIK